MGLFDLFRFSSVNHFPDSYAVDREVLYRLFRPMLEQQLELNKTVVLAMHFPAEFFVAQDLLAQWGIEYTVITRALDRQWFQDNKNADTRRPFMALSELLIDTEFPRDQPWHTSLALMMLDRHPRGTKDEAVSQFADRFPGRAEVGYFLSFEDDVVKRTIDNRMLDLLIQMGANDHGLIASAMLSKQIKKVLKRKSESFCSIDRPADSIAQWYDLNEV